MKKIFLPFIFASLLISQVIAQTYDLQFVTVTNDATNLDVKIQIKGNTAFKLGGSSIVFDYSVSSDISNPILLTAHNFSSSPYSLGLTTPAANEVSINILQFPPSEGTAEEVPTIWKDIATIRFDTDDPLGSADLSFLFSGTSKTAVYKVVGSVGTLLSNNLANAINVDPLPVELTSFSATNQKGNVVNLQWETATEVNNYGFEVERSIKTETADGKPETGMEWEKISFVEGSGNSNSQKLYSFVDKNPVGGTKFAYRLKQIDIDGTFEYSDLVEIEVLPTEYELYQNYPNPFNPSTKIKFSLPEDAKVAVDIYNMLGQRVMTLFNKDMKAGYHQVLFDTQSAGNQLASGVYIYTISTKNFSSVKKMVLLK